MKARDCPLVLLLVGLCTVGVAGCATKPAAPGPTTRKATDINRRRAEPAYWYNQPAADTVASGDFDELWAACERAARDLGFRIDRQDYRSGVITTHPLVSKQAFELWRRDVVTLDGIGESSLATVRRTVRFEVSGQEDGSFEAAPKVLVERYSVVEHRITSVTQYRDIFALTREEALRERDRQRNPMLEQEGIPTSYWYAIGRDLALERNLASAIRGKVKERPSVAVGAGL